MAGDCRQEQAFPTWCCGDWRASAGASGDLVRVLRDEALPRLTTSMICAVANGFGLPGRSYPSASATQTRLSIPPAKKASCGPAKNWGTQVSSVRRPPIVSTAQFGTRLFPRRAGTPQERIRRGRHPCASAGPEESCVAAAANCAKRERCGEAEHNEREERVEAANPPVAAREADLHRSD